MNNKKIQLSILTIFLAATLVGSAATFGVGSVQAEDRDHKKDKYDDKNGHHDKKEMKHDDHGDKKHDDKKEKKHYDKNGNSNTASQSIDQIQVSEQNAQCVSGTFTLISCNNVGFQFQNNDGNLALGQQ
jgi:ABC-type Zn2+ transport system substrate-binding protein/surface adhesin